MRDLRFSASHEGGEHRNKGARCWLFTETKSVVREEMMTTNSQSSSALLAEGSRPQLEEDLSEGEGFEICEHRAVALALCMRRALQRGGRLWFPVVGLIVVVLVPLAGHRAARHTAARSRGDETLELAHEIGAIDCLRKNSMYDPLDMPSQVMSITATAAECQRRCAGVEDCTGFTFIDMGGACHLADRNSILRVGRFGFCSAPRSCDSPATTSVPPPAKAAEVAFYTHGGAGVGPEEVRGAGCAPATSRAGGTRCCSRDGSSCISLCGDVPPASVLEVSHVFLSHAEAAGLCRRRHMRLCTRVELGTNICYGSGCWFDSSLVWTSEPCDLAQNQTEVATNTTASTTATAARATPRTATTRSQPASTTSLSTLALPLISKEDSTRDSEPTFHKLMTGTCKDIGLLPISNEDICKAAAEELQLPHTDVVLAHYADRPEGCYTYMGALWMSTNPRNMGNGADRFGRYPLCMPQALAKRKKTTAQSTTTSSTSTTATTTSTTEVSRRPPEATSTSFSPTTKTSSRISSTMASVPSWVLPTLAPLSPLPQVLPPLTLAPVILPASVVLATTLTTTMRAETTTTTTEAAWPDNLPQWVLEAVATTTSSSHTSTSTSSTSTSTRTVTTKTSTTRTTTSDTTTTDLEHSCRKYGCGKLVMGNPCQCNAACMQFGSCCWDYRDTCREVEEPQPVAKAKVGYGRWVAAPSTLASADCRTVCGASGAPCMEERWPQDRRGFERVMELVEDFKCSEVVEGIGARYHPSTDGKTCYWMGPAMSRCNEKAPPQTRRICPCFGNLELLLDERFEGIELDRSLWKVDVDCWGGGNNEKQCYRDNRENLIVENGKLTLRAVRGDYEGMQEGCTTNIDNSCTWKQPFTSAQIHSNAGHKGIWRYGRIEIRAQMPKGNFLWPAIWLLPEKPTYGTWASSGEIDIVEFKGNVPNALSAALHYWKEWPDDKFFRKNHTLEDDVDLSMGFHDFAFEWTADPLTKRPAEMRWTMDGEMFYKLEDLQNRPFFPAPYKPNERGGAPWDQPFYLMLTLAVGGSFFKNDELELRNNNDFDATAKSWASPVLLVEHVRIWTQPGLDD